MDMYVYVYVCMCVGAVIFCGVCVLAVITRYYIVSVMRAAKVQVSATGYIDFLRVG